MSFKNIIKTVIELVSQNETWHDIYIGFIKVSLNVQTVDLLANEVSDIWLVLTFFYFKIDDRFTKNKILQILQSLGKKYQNVQELDWWFYYLIKSVNLFGFDVENRSGFNELQLLKLNKYITKNNLSLFLDISDKYNLVSYPHSALFFSKNMIKMLIKQNYFISPSQKEQFISVVHRNINLINCTISNFVQYSSKTSILQDHSDCERYQLFFYMILLLILTNLLKIPTMYMNKLTTMPEEKFLRGVHDSGIFENIESIVRSFSCSDFLLLTLCHFLVCHQNFDTDYFQGKFAIKIYIASSKMYDIDDLIRFIDNDRYLYLETTFTALNLIANKKITLSKNEIKFLNDLSMTLQSYSKLSKKSILCAKIKKLINLSK